MARNLGGGDGPRSVMVYEVQDLVILSQSALVHHKETAMGLQRKMANELLKPLVEDIQDNPHRRALDTLVFDALNFTQVAARLQKASSLRGIRMLHSQLY